jgi:hypothetical protein
MDFDYKLIIFSISSDIGILFQNSRPIQLNVIPTNVIYEILKNIWQMIDTICSLFFAMTTWIENRVSEVWFGRQQTD